MTFWHHLDLETKATEYHTMSWTCILVLIICSPLFLLNNACYGRKSHQGSVNRMSLCDSLGSFNATYLIMPLYWFRQVTKVHYLHNDWVFVRFVFYDVSNFLCRAVITMYLYRRGCPGFAQTITRKYPLPSCCYIYGLCDIACTGYILRSWYHKKSRFERKCGSVCHHDIKPHNKSCSLRPILNSDYK